MKISKKILISSLLGLGMLVALSSFIQAPQEEVSTTQQVLDEQALKEALCSIQISDVSMSGPSNTCGLYFRNYKVRFKLKSPTVNARVRVTFISRGATVVPRTRNFVHEWSTCSNRTHNVSTQIDFPFSSPTNTFVRAYIYAEAYNSSGVVGSTSTTITKNVFVEDYNDCD